MKQSEKQTEMFIWEISIILNLKFGLCYSDNKKIKNLLFELNLVKSEYEKQPLKVLKCQCDGVSEVDGKICENPGADIQALSANWERCVSLELLHHHLQQLAWHSKLRAQQWRFLLCWVVLYVR